MTSVLACAILARIPSDRLQTDVADGARVVRVDPIYRQLGSLCCRSLLRPEGDVHRHSDLVAKAVHQDVGFREGLRQVASGGGNVRLRLPVELSALRLQQHQSDESARYDRVRLSLFQENLHAAERVIHLGAADDQQHGGFGRLQSLRQLLDLTHHHRPPHRAVPGPPSPPRKLGRGARPRSRPAPPHGCPPRQACGSGAYRRTPPAGRLSPGIPPR